MAGAGLLLRLLVVPAALFVNGEHAAHRLRLAVSFNSQCVRTPKVASLSTRGETP